MKINKSKTWRATVQTPPKRSKTYKTEEAAVEAVIAELQKRNLPLHYTHQYYLTNKNKTA